MATAVAFLLDFSDEIHQVGFLIDPGSEISLITDDLVTFLLISGIGDVPAGHINSDV